MKASKINVNFQKMRFNFANYFQLLQKFTFFNIFVCINGERAEKRPPEAGFAASEGRKIRKRGIVILFFDQVEINFGVG